MSQADSPYVMVWSNEADFKSGAQPLHEEKASGYELPSGIKHVPVHDVIVPDGAYVLLNTSGLTSAQATLHCASTTTPHRLAPWHLDPSGAAEGDTVTFDGVHWVAGKTAVNSYLMPMLFEGDTPMPPDGISAPSYWGLQEGAALRLMYSDGNTEYYGEPLRPSKTPLLQVVDSVDKLPTEVCAAILNTVPPKLILRGNDGQVYDAAGNLLP